METIRLGSGHTIPVLGLGTWTLRNEQCKTVVKNALALGYNHIDTAWMVRQPKGDWEMHCVRSVQSGKSFSLPPRFGTPT